MMIEMRWAHRPEQDPRDAVLQYRYREPRGNTPVTKLPQEVWPWSDWIDVPVVAVWPTTSAT